MNTIEYAPTLAELFTSSSSVVSNLNKTYIYHAPQTSLCLHSLSRI